MPNTYVKRALCFGATALADRRRGGARTGGVAVPPRHGDLSDRQGRAGRRLAGRWRGHRRLPHLAPGVAPRARSAGARSRCG